MGRAGATHGPVGMLGGAPVWRVKCACVQWVGPHSSAQQAIHQPRRGLLPLDIGPPEDSLGPTSEGRGSLSHCSKAALSSHLHPQWPMGTPICTHSGPWEPMRRDLCSHRAQVRTPSLPPLAGGSSCPALWGEGEWAGTPGPPVSSGILSAPGSTDLSLTGLPDV